MSKREEILLEWYKTPFDEEDAEAICGAESSVKCYTEVAMLWAMERAAKMLDQHYEGAHDLFLSIMRDEIEEEAGPETLEVEEDETSDEELL